MDCKDCAVGIARVKREWVRKRTQVECAASGRWRGPKATCDLSPAETIDLLECARRIGAERRCVT